MKYAELIQFDPIESVIQLLDTGKEEKALELVKNYVISDKMSEKICQIIIPQTQFDLPSDNKGLLIVGNYGTGKSHLMSFISAIAENRDFLPHINNVEVRSEAEKIAGRFQVIRTIIGSTEMSLRDILVSELEKHLEKMGVEYSFPQKETIHNHTSAFEDMMEKFAQVYPDQGLLLVVDELLDYLRSRQDQALILDLSFLREVGEICKNLRFRFMAGVQEAIFDSRRFAFVSEPIRRVKARFEQVLIARDDVKFVVAERLLKKDAGQQALIREHLTRFARFYENMNEHLDEFVRLFPIHPEYIGAFELIKAVERREVLKTISLTMKSLLQKEVPSDDTGIVSFDSYWENIKNDSSFRTHPAIGEVIDCSAVLESRIQSAMTRKQYIPMALRVIYGLSVHRLTTGDIYNPIGASAAELRDRLCLFEPMIAEMGGQEMEKDLLTHVETIMREISRTVSGQFISVNNNQQYYLDLKKTEDFNAQIEKRAETIDKSRLNSFYYEALRRVMECEDSKSSVSGHRIWEYERVRWLEHNVTRRGYLFFGTPNDRPTAVPQRDFYIYFIQPYEPPRFKDDKLGDEIFFRLKKYDADFENTLKNYAAAFELAGTAAGPAKACYEIKIGELIQSLVAWLQKNIGENFEVTHKGKTKSMNDWLKSETLRNISGLYPSESINFRDMVNAVSSACLSTFFVEQSPGYPKFSILLTRENLFQSASAAIKNIAGPNSTKQSLAVLDALGLLKDTSIDPTESEYANFIMDIVNSKGQGQVTNRSELISEDHGVQYMNPQKYRLEPELVVVLLAALVYSGDLVLSLSGKKIDATALGELSKIDINDLVNFKHVEKPKEWNLGAIKALFELAGLAPGMAQNVSQGREEPIQELQKRVDTILDDIVSLQQSLKKGLFFFDFDLTCLLNCQITNSNSDSDSDSAAFDTEKSVLDKAKGFFESIKIYSSSGKMKNFRHGVSEIKSHEQAMKTIKNLSILQKFVNAHSADMAWLKSAEVGSVAELIVLSDWRKKLQTECEAAIAKIKKELEQAEPQTSRLSNEIRPMLNSLKSQYINIYMQLHKKARLNINEDKRKIEFLQDPRFITLNKLGGIHLMPLQQFKNFQNKLASLQCCANLTEKELQINPICPHCSFRLQPDFSQDSEAENISASAKLQNMDSELDKMLSAWTNSLLSNLKDPATSANINLLTPVMRKLVTDFLKSETLPQPPEENLIKALQEVFSGLIKVSVSIKELQKALRPEGGSCTLAEIKRRFENYMEKLTAGKDQNQVRIVLE